MDFSPFNPIVKRCLQGMALEEQGKPEEAIRLFREAWDQAGTDFERFLAAWYLARHPHPVAERLRWLETALQCALQSDTTSAQSALPTLHTHLAQCLAESDPARAKEHTELARQFQKNPADTGPFYHGTKADLQPGDLLRAGGNSNYQAELKMNHIYFTAQVNGAGLAAALAKGEGQERVYLVEPTGSYEHDPNLTDKKFPGNPTRSYRSESPLKVLGEVNDWVRPGPEELQRFREKVEKNTGGIINE